MLSCRVRVSGAFAGTPRTPRARSLSAAGACDLLARRDCASRRRAQVLAAAARPRDDKTRRRLLSCVALPPASARPLRANCDVQYRRRWPLRKPRWARCRWPPRTLATRCALWSWFAALVRDSVRACRTLSRESGLRRLLARLLCLKHAAHLVATQPPLCWAAFALPKRLHARTTTLCAKLAVVPSISRALERTRCRR